jgi:hypothetical protein
MQDMEVHAGNRQLDVDGNRVVGVTLERPTSNLGPGDSTAIFWSASLEPSIRSNLCGSEQPLLRCSSTRRTRSNPKQYESTGKHAGHSRDVPQAPAPDRRSPDVAFAACLSILSPSQPAWKCVSSVLSTAPKTWSHHGP